MPVQIIEVNPIENAAKTWMDMRAKHKAPDPKAAIQMTLLAETHPSSSPREHGAAPRIAVIVSCYNYEAYVGKAIRSVLDQQCAEFELIAVDDGSTDNSWEVITQTGVKAFRIENRGQPGACLFGVEATTAPFILFLDADDELRPGALQIILAALDDQVAKLQFPLVWVNEAGDVLMTSPDLKDGRDRGRIARQILKTSVYLTPPTSGNVFRRDVALLLREIEPGDGAVDGAIIYAAPFMGDVVSLSKPLGIYRLHNSNQSGVGGRLDPEMLERNMCRHIARMVTLRKIFKKLSLPQTLVDPRKTFYFRDLEFMMSVTTGQRNKISRLATLLKALWLDYLPSSRKIALSVWYLVVAVSTSSKAKKLLEYRLNPSGRSSGGFLKLVFS